MKPETVAFLEKARELLHRAPALLASEFTEEAGRAAYLSGYHAAQAMIFQREGKVFKTHNGVQSEFARIVKDDPHFDGALRGFLGRAYNLKAVADYESGPGSKVTHSQAAEAINSAGRFVDVIEMTIGK